MAELVEALRPELDRVLRQLLAQPKFFELRGEDRDDLLQEVLGRLAVVLPRFRGRTWKLVRSYARVVVRSAVGDRHRFFRAARRDVRRRETDNATRAFERLPAVDPTPSSAAALGESVQLYHEVLETFGERSRRLLRGRIERQESFVQLARTLGFATEDAARKSFHKAHATLLVRLAARGLDG